MIDYKYPTIASGATPIGSASRSPDEKNTSRRQRVKNEEENFESIVGGKHQKINSTFHSHRESGFKNPTILAIAFEDI
jgi:hypothetical protein